MEDNSEPDSNKTVGSEKEANQKGRRSRRSVLEAFAASSAGVTIFSQRVYGNSRSGRLVDIVIKRDNRGKPKKVEKISKEHYNNIDSIIKTGPDLLNNYSSIYEVSIVDDGPGHTMLEARIEPGTSPKKADGREIPEEVNGIQILTKEKLQKNGSDDCSGGWGQDWIDPVEGCAGIEARDRGFNHCTLCVVGYDTSQSYKAGITTYHCLNGDTSFGLEQSGRDIGIFREKNEGLDVAKFEITDDANTQNTHHEDLPDIKGYWTLAGLHKRLESHPYDPIPVEFSGQSTCFTSNEARDLAFGPRVDYQVNFFDREATGGDSGGPWVDADGDLVAMHQGLQGGLNADRGVAPQPIIDELGITL